MEQMSKDIGRRLTLGINSRNCLQLRNDLHVTIKRPLAIANRSIQFSFSSRRSNKFESEIYKEGNFFRGFSSVGRASALQAECHRFDSGNLHQIP